MATPKKQTPAKQSKPRAKTRQATAAATGDCNPCFEQSAGLLTCDGSNPVVVPFPADGKWVVTVYGGKLKLINGAGIIPDEDASEPTAPGDEELPPPPAPAPE